MVWWRRTNPSQVAWITSSADWRSCPYALTTCQSTGVIAATSSSTAVASPERQAMNAPLAMSHGDWSDCPSALRSSDMVTIVPMSVRGVRTPPC